MFKLKNLLTIFIVFSLVILVSRITFASDLNLPSLSNIPNNYFAYSIQRLIEKGTLIFKFNHESKISYYKDLINIRIAELKYVVENKLIGEIEKSTQRFSYQIGTLADYVSSNKDLAKDKKSTIDFLSQYKNLLENLRDQYPANSSYWMLVQHSINSIDLNLEKLR